MGSEAVESEGGTGGGPDVETAVEGLGLVSLVGAERDATADDGGTDATETSDGWDDDEAEAALAGMDEQSRSWGCVEAIG